MRPMLAEMDGRDFRIFMETFLRFADKPWGRLFNYAWSLGMFLGPIAALVLLWDEPSSAPFVLTAIGLGIVFVGVIVVSNVWKEPLYKVILAWNPDAMPADWQAGRRRYFAINWIQFAATWAAFALFLVALGLLWPWIGRATMGRPSSGSEQPSAAEDDWAVRLTNRLPRPAGRRVGTS